MSQAIDAESREIVIREQPHEALALPDHATARAQLAKVRDFQAVVRQLFVEGHDFGVIPGTGSKATLLKPGAEKLIKLLGLADTYDFLDRVEDWDREFFNYTVRCRLVSLQTGQIVAEGLGNCNSRESKYRWRWLWPNDLTEAEKVGLKTRSLRNGGKQYRVENDDVPSSINTIIKMAKKRAQVDAALSVGRLSDVFTQDLEDLQDQGEDTPTRQPEARPPTRANAPPRTTTPAQAPSNSAPPLDDAVDADAIPFTDMDEEPAPTPKEMREKTERRQEMERRMRERMAEGARLGIDLAPYEFDDTTGDGGLEARGVKLAAAIKAKTAEPAKA